MFSYFAFLAAIAAPQVTMSVLNKLDTSYNVVIRVLYFVMIDVIDDLDVVFLREYSTFTIVHITVAN